MSTLLGVKVRKGNVIIFKLLKALNGLKEAGLMWYLTLRELFLEIGFKPCVQETCIFLNENETVYVGIYLDDCTVAGQTETHMNETFTAMKKTFDLDECELSDFLSMFITREKDSLSMNNEEVYREGPR